MRAQTAQAPACAYDIDICWGEEQLCAEHVSPAVPFVLAGGIEPLGEARVFVVDEQWLEGPLRTLVSVENGEPWVERGSLRVRLEAGVEISTTVGPLSIRVRGAEPERVAALHTRELDLNKQRWTLASLALHLLALGCMALLPPRASSMSLDLAANDVARMRYLMTPVELPPPPPFQGSTAGASAPALGETGPVKPGRPRGKPAPRRQVSSPNPGDPASPTVVSKAGILGVLPSVATQLGPDGPFTPGTFGDDPMAVLERLYGAVGSGGPEGGLRGPGRIGGGVPHGTIGGGPIDTRTGANIARGVPIGMPKHGDIVPRVRPRGDATVRGSLSKEAIRRSIQRHLNEVRFCYEEALRATPELAGRLSVSFLIAPSGVVQASALGESSLGNDRVEQCIVQAVRRWTFPAPDGGGYVQVTYPFLLEQAER